MHWKTALKDFVYIKSFSRKRLFYKKCRHVHISASSDAGHVGDKGNKKSTTRYLIFVGGNLVA